MKVLIIMSVVIFPLLGLMESKAPGNQDSISELQLNMAKVAQIQKIEVDRQQSELKIYRIIQRFNPDMPKALRKAVAREIIEMSSKYPNLDANLICATITHESARSWEPKVTSSAGAMGLMQIMPATGKWLAQMKGIQWSNAENVLFNPIYNIRLGSHYLSYLIEMYELDGGLAAYNGGGKIVERWLANNKADGILWDETQNYIPNVLNLYAEFRSTN